MDAVVAERLVNAVLFDIDRVSDLTAPDTVTDCVDAMFAQRYFTQPPADFLQAVDIVSAQGELAARTLRLSRRFGGEELMTFIRAVGVELRSRSATTPVDLLAAAVADNVRWCGVVCGTAPSVDDTGLWIAEATPHPLYPDLVTARPGVPGVHVATRLADRARCSVKDSFADLDLGPAGFTVLFDARWIAIEAVPSTARANSYGWSVVTSDGELARWSSAAGLPVSLPAHILSAPGTTVVTCTTEGLTAGFVATETDGVVGLSNVWGPIDTVWRSVLAGSAQLFPGRPLVGYEHGDALAAALAAGFEPLGPLRVWVRDG